MNKSTITKSLPLTVAGIMLMLAGTANASFISGIGSHTDNTTASNCPSYCTSGGGGQFSRSVNGGENTSETYSEENSFGESRAYASFIEGSYLPLLRVETSAELRKGSFANAFAAQNYTYTGSGTKTIEIDINLHGSVENNTGGYVRNQLRADFAIVTGTDLEWYPDFATLIYELAVDNVVYNNSLFISSGIDVNVSDTFSFDISENESFYVISSMGAASKNGYADAWNTLSMTFDDNSNLQAAIQGSNVAAIPEPQTFALFSLAIALMGLRLRK